ncbi:dUTP diphosphatase [Psychrobacillus sp.]|uniref:dUTP diphosphatase n=1 Tax=Psychrobacillus sp. TaxID=1871623 RepID=UPI0028BEA3EF|nr:dUTP diphosphatase [Psychrobacillus sp.]
MNLEKLFTMQQALDEYIQSNKQVDEDVFIKKGLALLVELSELANETRCFKFWTNKGPSERAIILEEYVDSIHFLLSLGIEKDLQHIKSWPTEERAGDLTKLFISTSKANHDFLDNPTMELYKEVWIQYGAIAKLLGFSNEEVINAYISKNEKNYERQRTGY